MFDLISFLKQQLIHRDLDCKREKRECGEGMTLYSCSDISYNKNYVVLVHNISCDYIQISCS